MKDFDTHTAMVHELNEKKFTIIDKSIFFNSEYAGSWHYKKQLGRVITPDNATATVIDLVRKYQYYD
jgi:hypothetical protein